MTDDAARAKNDFVAGEDPKPTASYYFEIRSSILCIVCILNIIKYLYCVGRMRRRKTSNTNVNYNSLQLMGRGG